MAKDKKDKSEQVKSESPAEATAENATAAAAEGDIHLEAVADALAAAAEAVDDTEHQPAEAAAMPAGVLGRAVYRTAYCVSYGVVFPHALMMSFLPDNAIGHGLTDGAQAARDAVDSMRAQRAAEAAAEPAGHAAEAGDEAFAPA